VRIFSESRIGKLHVRFDEREVETEYGRLMRPRQTKEPDDRPA